MKTKAFASLILLSIFLSACTAPSPPFATASPASPVAPDAGAPPQHEPPNNGQITVAQIQSSYSIASSGLSGWFATGQAADLTLSAVDFNNAGGSLFFNHPTAIITDGTRLALADRNNNRVLIWNTLPTSNEEPDIVLGQPDFNSNNPGTSANQMNWPVAMSIGGGKLIVADSYNDRILIWNSFPTQNAQPADMILETVMGRRIECPWGVWTDGTRLAVVNTPIHEVLIWNTFPTTPEQPADFALTAAGQMGTPRSIISNGEYFIVGDHNASTGAAAYPNWAYSFPEQPNGFALANGQLVVMGRSALYIWDHLPLDGEMPDTTLALNGYDLGKISGMTYDGKYLYLADTNANAIHVWDGLPQTSDTPPVFTLNAGSHQAG